jgi:50S ribosomal protein L16 3-hydroxylase
MDSSTELLTAPDVKPDPFNKLLSPFDVNQFFRGHWRRKPLCIPGDEKKFSDFPSLKELPSLLSGRFAGNRWIKGHAHSATANLTDHSGNIRQINAPPSMWPDLFNAGVSLCFSSLDRYDERLAQFVRSIASSTQFPGTIYTTGYLTPPFSGSSMHFDSQHVFFMQVSGKKHWKFSQRPAWEEAPVNLPVTSVGSPALKRYLESFDVAVGAPEETGLEEVTLMAGDLLYLPPGFWHEASTSDDHSLHYTLTLQPIGPWQLLVTYLRRSYFEKTMLRRDLRYAVESGDGDITSLLDAAIAQLREDVNGLTADDVQRFFAEASSDNPLKSQFMLP